MKKIISLVVVFVMILSLSACGQNETNMTTSTEPTKAVDSTTAPSEPENDIVEITVAESDGMFLDYNISDGNVYMIDVTNYDNLPQGGWSVSIAVGDSFDMNSIQYLGCCNEYLESVDIEIRCELMNANLTIKSMGSVQNADSVYSSLYLVVVSEELAAGETVRFVPHADGSTTGTELREVQKMTGEIVLFQRICEFSEGYCWAQLMYSDTNQKITAVIDTNGNLISELNDEWIVSRGEFHNGVSLVEYDTGVCMFVDADSNILFYSDNPDYQDMIKGIYPGGYIFMERNEANLTSNTTYYAIMDCNENFIIDWTEYNGFYLFNYMGGDVFAFLDGFERGDDDTAKFFNAETKVWTTVSNIDGGSLWRLPDFVADDSDGWLVIGEGLERVSGGGILVSTRDGKTYTLDSNYEYGIPYDGRIVIVDTGYYDDDFNGLGYVNIQDATYDMIDYGYLNLVRHPEKVWEKVRMEAAVELGYWPSYNAPGVIPSNMYNTTNTTTYLFDLVFSNGVMLLQLKGADGLDYYALMNEQGENVFEPVKGTAVDTLGEGRFLVSREGNYYIIDEQGKDVDILSGKDYGMLSSAEEYRDGLSWVETFRDVNGFIDVNGNYVFGEGDALKTIQTIALTSVTVSGEWIEVGTTVDELVDNEEANMLKETPSTAFEYEYGHVEVKISEGVSGFEDAVVITKYVGNDDVVVIPAEIDGLPVLKIAESAFAGSDIKELYFAGFLTVIEEEAFANCTKLELVVLPDNWMYLGNRCFAGCTSLAQLEIPSDYRCNVEEVWNEELYVYQYIEGSPVGEDDSTVVVTREK